MLVGPLFFDTQDVLVSALAHGRAECNRSSLLNAFLRGLQTRAVPEGVSRLSLLSTGMTTMLFHVRTQRMKEFFLDRRNRYGELGLIRKDHEV